MPVTRIEFLVEEPSMEAFLMAFLPRLIPNIDFQVYQFQCKTELLTQLPARLRAYSSYLPNDWRVCIVVDRDDDRCLDLKNQIESFVSVCGLGTRKFPARGIAHVLTRIAIEELEAWYFGDWNAVRTAYPKMNATIPQKEPFRAPDDIKGGTWEAFERVAKKVGYFAGGLRKVEAAGVLGQTLTVDNNNSPSFQSFCQGLLSMLAEQ